MKQEKSFIKPQMNANGHEYIIKNLRKSAFIRGIIIMCITSIIPFGVFADEIAVDTIVHNANRTSYYQGKDGLVGRFVLQNDYFGKTRKVALELEVSYNRDGL